jgi:hypothetical protein
LAFAPRIAVKPATRMHRIVSPLLLGCRSTDDNDGNCECLHKLLQYNTIRILLDNVVYEWRRRFSPVAAQQIRVIFCRTGDRRLLAGSIRYFFFAGASIGASATALKAHDFHCSGICTTSQGTTTMQRGAKSCLNVLRWRRRATHQLPNITQGSSVAATRSKILFFSKNCTCKDFINEYDHKKFICGERSDVRRSQPARRQDARIHVS